MKGEIDLTDSMRLMSLVGLILLKDSRQLEWFGRFDEGHDRSKVLDGGHDESLDVEMMKIGCG